MIGRFDAYRYIHFRLLEDQYRQAVLTAKFEELFYAAQDPVGSNGKARFSKGWVFEKVGTLFNDFYENHLPFGLTNAQKM